VAFSMLLASSSHACLDAATRVQGLELVRNIPVGADISEPHRAPLGVAQDGLSKNPRAGAVSWDVRRCE
jgi:hypothetical protein